MPEQSETLSQSSNNPELSELQEYVDAQDKTKTATDSLQKSIIDNLLESIKKTWNDMTSGLFNGLKSVPILGALLGGSKTLESSSNKTETHTYSTSFEIDPNKSISQQLSEVILVGESGFNYGAVNKNDNGSVSIGLMQRHGPRAVDVLKKLRDTDPTKFDTIMTDPLFKNLQTAGMSKWNDIQANQFKKLMNEKEFQTTTNHVLEEDCEGYINTIKNRGISDPKCLLTLGRIYNAGPNLAKQVFDSIGVTNDYTRYIDAFKGTSYVAKRGNFFDKKIGDKTLAQRIGGYSNPTGSYYA